MEMAFATIDLEAFNSLTEGNRGCKSTINQTEHNDKEVSEENLKMGPLNHEESESPAEDNGKEVSEENVKMGRLNQEESESLERGVLTYDENHQKWIRYRVIPRLVSDEEWEKAAVSKMGRGWPSGRGHNFLHNISPHPPPPNIWHWFRKMPLQTGW